MKNILFIKIFILAYIIILALSGCSGKKVDSTNQQKNPPQDLIKIEEGIDEIISLLDKEGQIQKTPESSSNQNQSPKESKDSNSDSGSKEDSKSGSSKEDSKASSSESNTQAPVEKSVWDDVDKTIKEIHKSWNEYHPIAIKDGSKNDIVDGFDTDLNILSNSVANKNLMSTLDNGNNLYKYIPEFFKNYSSDQVNIKRLKYYSRDVMYKSRFDKWDLAFVSIDKCNETFENINTQLKEQFKELVSTLEYSIKDLEKVTTEKQKSLTQIKGNLVLENIKNLDKQIKSEKENK